MPNLKATITSSPVGVTKIVTQQNKAVSVKTTSKNQVSVVEKGSFALAAAASDKHKSMSINVQSWLLDGDEFVASFSHGLNKKPSVTIVDSFDEVKYMDVEYVDNNTVKIISTSTFSGRVYFN